MNRSVLARRLLKGSSVFLILALVIFLFHAMEPNVETFSRFVDDNIRESGVVGIGMYLGLVAVLVCMGVPRQLLAFAGGYAFGALLGGLWATLGVTLGCVLSFSYSRIMGQRFVQQRFGQRIDKLEKFLLQAPLAMTFIIRCLPVGNNLVTNILAGVTRIPAVPFFVGSCLGYIPQNFIFALLGSGIHVDPFWRTAASAALFVFASAVGWAIYRHYRVQVDTVDGN